MNHDELVEYLLEKDCYMIDFLPELVSSSSEGNFSEVEQYFLQKEELADLAEKWIRIILKLSCYFKIEVYHNTWLFDLSSYELSSIIKRLITKKKGFINILFKEENTLLQVNSGFLHFTIFQPSEDIKRLAAALAASEGLFWRAGVK